MGKRRGALTDAESSRRDTLSSGTQVRVYLPATLPALSRAYTARAVAAARGCAVTPALRTWYGEADEEELEFAALSLAARSSLDLLEQAPDAPRRRVVLAVDAPARDVDEAPAADAEADPAAVILRMELPWNRVEAVHVDDPGTSPLVTAALEHPDDESAQSALEDVDLLWFATQEVEDLL